MILGFVLGLDMTTLHSIQSNLDAILSKSLTYGFL
jgi:hypothetical protein